MRAYLAARLALKDNLERIVIVQDILGGLQNQVSLGMREILIVAGGVGNDQAGKSLAAYGIPSVFVGNPGAAGLEAVNSALNAQVTSVQALAMSGADDALILGDETRSGMLTPGPVIREGSRWITLDVVAAYVESIGYSLGRAGDRDGYLKQAIAAIDHKTTDCCLRVHGQVQPLDEDFHLTGEPRYADYLPYPGFHWWCRTATALVSRQDVEDQLTQQMRDAGQAELAAREETGTRETIWPSHARSGRN